MVVRPNTIGRYLIQALALLVVLAIVSQTLYVNVNVTAPSPGQHYTTTGYPYPSCGFQYSQTTYRVIVDSIAADRQTYGPGDTITISGTVELQAYTYGYDSCYCYPGRWNRIDPSTASVYLQLYNYANSKWASASSSLHPDTSGNYAFTYQVPQDQAVGTLTFRVTSSPASQIWYGGCSPLFTADDAVGRKTVQVSIQSVPLSITLTVTPLSGQAPITPNWSTRRSGGQAPFTWVIYWGDGTSDDVSNCSQNCPSHTYTIPGTYTITLKVTDASGKTASDSKTITVYGAPNSTSTTSSSTQPPPQPPPFPPQPIPPVACDPTITVVTIIVAILAGIAFIIVFRDWIFGLFGGAAFILAIIVAFFVAAVFIFANGNVCNPVVTILAVIIITVIIVWIVQRPRPRPPPLPPPPLPPPGGNVAGNATVTGPGGGTTQLTNANLNQVGPGSTVETGPGSFVKAPTPQGSNSQSVIGQNSRVSWLDPNFKTQIPWLRFPGLSQIYNLGSLLLRLDFGKLLLSWVQAAATQEAVIILPASLIGAATSAAMSRWLARIKGTMVLVEAAQDGTSAAITVLEGEAGKESSVELWRSDDLNKVIEIHPGERVILNAGRRPTKTSVDLAKGLTQQIQDPFRILQKWWTIPPMSNETNAALKTSGQSSSGTIPGEKTSVCTNCGMKIPSDTKFCSHCGHERKRP